MPTSSHHLTPAVRPADVVDVTEPAQLGEPETCASCGRRIDDGRMPWPAHVYGWPCAGPACHALLLADWPAAEPGDGLDVDELLPPALDGSTDLVERVSALAVAAQLVAGLARLCEAPAGEQREHAEAELCALWAVGADQLHRAGPAAGAAGAALRDAAVELRRIARDQR